MNAKKLLKIHFVKYYANKTQNECKKYLKTHFECDNIQIHSKRALEVME